MTMPRFTAEAALVANKEGHYGEVQRPFTVAPRDTVFPQVVEWCLPCRGGVRLCCNPWMCYVVQCSPA
jgi:hypothetical protein